MEHGQDQINIIWGGISFTDIGAAVVSAGYYTFDWMFMNITGLGLGERLDNRFGSIYQW